MTSQTLIIDREPVHDSFHQWQSEQTAFDAQLTESVAALAAYQSHLDRWQQELAAERDELHRAREASKHDESLDGAQRQQFDEITRELDEARQKLASLTSGLLTRTEELRELDRQHADTTAELLLARARENELTAALEVQEKSRDNERTEWEAKLARLQEQVGHAAEISAAPSNEHIDQPTTNVPSTNKPSASANPVLGTIMEQFGKLRQQRSVGRPSLLKPR